MNGYEIISATDDLLVLEPVAGKIFLLIFALIGLTGIIIFTLIRMNVLRSVPQNLHYVLLGFGIVFFCGGLIFLLDNSPHRIVMDNNKQVIAFYEKYLWETEQVTEIPFNQIIGIKVSTPFSADLSGIQAEKKSLILHIVLKDSSMLGLQESESESDLINNGKQIAEFLYVDLYLMDSLVCMGTPGMIGKFSIPEYRSEKINLVTLENASMYAWTQSRSLIHSGLLFLVITGFNLIIFKVPFRSMINKFLAVIVILGLNLALMTVVAFSVFGSQILILGPDSIILQNKVLGFQVAEKSLNKKDIAVIQTGLTDHDNGMIIMTGSAVRQMEQMAHWAASRNMKNPGLGDMMAIARTAMTFRDQILQIEGRSLSFGDRMYLKQQIQLWFNKEK